ARTACGSASRRSTRASSTSGTPWTGSEASSSAASSARWIRRGRGSLSRAHRFLGAPLHLLLGHVLGVRREHPAVAERVLERAGAIAVELVARAVDLGRAGVDRPVVERVDVLGVDQDRARERLVRLGGGEPE